MSRKPTDRVQHSEFGAAEEQVPAQTIAEPRTKDSSLSAVTEDLQASFGGHDIDNPRGGRSMARYLQDFERIFDEDQDLGKSATPLAKWSQALVVNRTLGNAKL